MTRSIGEVCQCLSQAAHEAGRHRVSFLLHEAFREAELTVDVELGLQRVPTREGIAPS